MIHANPLCCPGFPALERRMQVDQLKRREFITLLGGVAAAGPVAVRAQPGERVRRIGLLDAWTDEGSRANRVALAQGLAALGWIEGRNLKTEQRFGGGDADRMGTAAAELVALTPDLIVAFGAAPTRALQHATQTIPIVFTAAGDAAAIGLVKDIAHPDGNTTGFSSFEPTMAGKWLELLKQAAPRLARIAVVFNPDLAPTALRYLAVIEPAARALAVQAIKMPFRDTIELVRAIDAFAAEPNGGLLVLPPPIIPETIIKLAAQHRLPAMYAILALAADGGLLAYGADYFDQHRRAAAYVDRLLRGAKVSELPVQFPTKYLLVVNVKTAKAIGLAIPEAFLLQADELIE
jgi:putative tryptophan/tyrosine transport system substrate-binding protein